MTRKRIITNSALYLLGLALLLVPAGCGGGDSGGAPSRPNSITLTWVAPTTNEDGTELTDLAGFRVYFGTSSNPKSYATPVRLGAGTNTYTTPGLAPGTYYFVVTALDTSGNESAPSTEVWTTVQ